MMIANVSIRLDNRFNQAWAIKTPVFGHARLVRKYTIYHKVTGFESVPHVWMLDFGHDYNDTPMFCMRVGLDYVN